MSILNEPTRNQPETGSERRPILSVADALDHAAEQLTKMAADQGLMALIGGALKQHPGLMDDAPAVVKAVMVEPERQERALRAAARIVRDLATEHRLQAVRDAERARAKDGAK